MLHALSTGTSARIVDKRPRPKAHLWRTLLAACVTAGFSALASLASAEDYRTGTFGGSGGGVFTLRCAPGDYLVGLRARAGDWLDAIAPLCANWDVGQQKFLPPGLGPMRGGNGGSPDQIDCNDTSAIRQITLEIRPDGHRNVAMLLPECHSVVTLERTDRPQLDYFGATLADRQAAADGLGSSFRLEPGLSRTFRCREGDFAVGIYGASGAYVDRIGLICGTPPRVRPPIIILPTPAPPASTPSPADTGSNLPDLRPRCRQGFVWREARPTDYVCVTPQSRSRVRAENTAAPSRIDPNGAYGPASCVSGYVWREAFAGDLVCVTPSRRDQVREENRQAPNRVAP